MAEVVKQHKDGASIVEDDCDTARNASATDGSEGGGASSPDTSDVQSRPLSDEERRALLERERARMADPAYPQTLEDPTGVIEALLHHHGRR
jgi:hypothetical protein